MRRKERLAAIRAERLSLAEFLESLEAADWDVRSLCPEWTVREVVAHLTLATRETVPGVLREVVRAKGDVDRVFAESARRRASEYTPAELIEQLRDSAESSKRLLLGHPMDSLVDILVHGQDIARPLGRHRELPVERVLPALNFAWRSVFYGGRKRFRGQRLIGTDAEFSAGAGPRELRGPVAELLLLATGRPSTVTQP